MALVVACTLGGALNLLTPAAVLASDPAVEDRARMTARELARQGLEAYDAGNYAEAHELLARAQQLVDAPSITVQLARSLQRLGRWVEAAETFRRCSRYPVNASSPQPFIDAVDAATNELRELEPQIPRLTIVLEPANAMTAEARVTLNGQPLAQALLGAAVPVDPGTHEVAARHPSGESASEVVQLVPGQSQRISLRLRPADSSASDAPSTTRGTLPRPRSTSNGTQRLLGFVSLGVGGIGLATGGVVGVIALGKRDDAEQLCPSSKCVAGSPGEEAMRSFRAYRTLSTVGYVAGALGVGAGAVLLLTAPSSESVETGFVSPYMTPTSTGLYGRF